MLDLVDQRPERLDERDARRQQRRQLRVTSSTLQRIHPMTGEVRHSVPLVDLVLLTRTKDGLRVSFRGESEREVITDTYSTQYATEIINSVKRRYPKVPIATEEEEGRYLLSRKEEQ